MQNHTFQPNKKMKEIYFFFYLNVDKAKNEKYQQVKNQEKNFGLITDRKESLQEITC
jgi:hypothetical protein